MMGTSLLAMPWAIGQSGLLLGPLMSVLMGLIAGFTAYLISSLSNKAKSRLTECHISIGFFSKW